MLGRLADIRYRVFRPTAPIAAGNSLDISPEGGRVWWVRSIVATLQTSAVAGNRFVEVRLSDGTTTYYRASNNGGQAAGLTLGYSAFPGAQHAGVASSVVFIPLDTNGLIVPDGHRLSLFAVNGDAGDQYSAVAVFAYEYETGPLAAAVPIPEPYVAAFDPTYIG